MQIGQWILGHASRRWHSPDAGATPALCGPANASALLAGVTGCLLLPGLPPRGVLALLALFGLWLLPRASVLRLAGAFLLGLGLAGWQADAALRAQLPASLEGRALELQGRIAGLPLHEPRRTRFEFVVDATEAAPPELRGQRLRIARHDDDVRARSLLQAGSRWQLPVRLRPPRGLRNPGPISAPTANVWWCSMKSRMHPSCLASCAARLTTTAGRDDF